MTRRYGTDIKSYVFLKKEPFNFFSRTKSYTFIEFIEKLILKEFTERRMN